MWIPVRVGRHAHNTYAPRELSLEEMKAARWRGDPNPLAAEDHVSVEWEWHNPLHEVKDFPDEL